MHVPAGIVGFSQALNLITQCGHLYFHIKPGTEGRQARLNKYSIPLATFISDNRSMNETISVNSGRSYK